MARPIKRKKEQPIEHEKYLIMNSSGEYWFNDNLKFCESIGTFYDTLAEATGVMSNLDLDYLNEVSIVTYKQSQTFRFDRARLDILRVINEINDKLLSDYDRQIDPYVKVELEELLQKVFYEMP